MRPMHLPIDSLTGIPGGKRLSFVISAHSSFSCCFCVIPSWQGLGILGSSGSLIASSCVSMCGAIFRFKFGLSLSAMKCRDEAGVRGIHFPV